MAGFDCFRLFRWRWGWILHELRAFADLQKFIGRQSAGFSVCRDAKALGHQALKYLSPLRSRHVLEIVRILRQYLRLNIEAARFGPLRQIEDETAAHAVG